MKSLFLLVSSALLIAAAPAPDAATRADVRCFIALSILGNNDDPVIKQVASAGTLYFLGRLDGRSPALNIEAAVTAEIPTLTDTDINSLFKSCGATIKGRGEHLIAIGKALEKRVPRP